MFLLFFEAFHFFFFFAVRQVREDAAREGCIYMPQETSPTTLKPQTTPLCKRLKSNEANLSLGTTFAPLPLHFISEQA
jgi:hypothetical protein